MKSCSRLMVNRRFGFYKILRGLIYKLSLKIFEIIILTFRYYFPFTAVLIKT